MTAAHAAPTAPAAAITAHFGGLVTRFVSVLPRVVVARPPKSRREGRA
jgi:hypothetical protein